MYLLTQRPERNDHRFVHDIPKCIRMSPKFVSVISVSGNDSSPIYGAKPLPEPMVTQFPDAHMRNQPLCVEYSQI